MSVLLDLAIRSSFILGLGLLFGTILGKRSAALRHCVLASAIGASAAVAPLSLALPAWVVSLPASRETPVPAPALSPAVPVTALPAVAGDPGVGGLHARIEAARPLAAGVWLAGFLVAAGMLLAGAVRLMRIASRGGRVRSGRWTRIAAAVADGYGLRRDIVILQTDAPDLLATWGVFRPRVLLPSHAREWTDDRIRVVLSHELAHIRRLDWLVQMCAEAMRTVLWFNPLIWIACTRLRRESEQACDDAVLGTGVRARDYAEHLLELARKCRRPESQWASAVPMARPSTLERRIADMLNPALDRKALSPRTIALTTALLLAIALPAAALRAGQSTPAPLSGSIYDATGGVLPGVDVTLEDVTQMKFQARTDASGRFGYGNVQPGRYVLQASLPGFRTLRQEFDLSARPDWDRAITLQVGDLRETVTVSATRASAQAAPQPRGPQPIRVGGNIRAPRKEVDVRPVYPASMREAGREGLVPIDAVVGSDGSVTSVRVVSAQVHPDFAIAAVDAVRQWRFSPTLLNGKPVEVVMTVSVAFKLSDQ